MSAYDLTLFPEKPAQVIDRTGQRFGKLTVVSFGGFRPNPRKHRPVWICRCDCGAWRAVRIDQSKSSANSSCGCHSKVALATNKTHGLSESKVHRAWSKMKSRCGNPRNKYFSYYGGRGINVCSRWLKFENFLEDVGLPPTPKHTLDRYPDNNGNYEPGNVRWASRKEQLRNRRNNWLLTIGDETYCIGEWAERFKISDNVLRSRLRLGWPPLKALTFPVKWRKPRPVVY